MIAIDIIASADGLSRLQRPPTRENREPLKHQSFRHSQQVVAPVESRLQGLLAWQGCPAAAGQQPKALVQATRDLFGSERLDSRRGKLKCQGNAIQPSTDLNHRSGVSGG